jgi:multisubunit Na+/H+ antiporter MnhE subunit
MKHRSNTRLVFGLVFAVLCTSCAVRYGPRTPGFQPGYTDQQLGEATYQIKIGEAWPKDWPDLEKFAVFRAAEITASKSKRYFTILNASSQTSTYFVNTPTTSTTSATASRVGNTTYINATTTTTPGTTSAISGGWYTLDFRVLSDAEIVSYERVVDSEQVKRDLQYFINSRR